MPAPFNISYSGRKVNDFSLKKKHPGGSKEKNCKFPLQNPSDYAILTIAAHGCAP